MCGGAMSGAGQGDRGWVGLLDSFENPVRVWEGKVGAWQDMRDRDLMGREGLVAVLSRRQGRRWATLTGFIRESRKSMGGEESRKSMEGEVGTWEDMRDRGLMGQEGLVAVLVRVWEGQYGRGGGAWDHMRDHGLMGREGLVAVLGGRLREARGNSYWFIRESRKSMGGVGACVAETGFDGTRGFGGGAWWTVEGG
ncbi:hypothetical protein C8R45DRAFT_942311 [Mycena sanguinolenta]|nr:hypothetical protein C8R45DRAFT_942311 [Mycena sanguinolenta]